MSGFRTPEALDLAIGISLFKSINRFPTLSLSLSLSKCMHACIYYICFSTVVCLVLITQGYWNWSWDELAKFDLPAVFDYVYNETGQKIHYVGHSQV
jgi:hypothetical protein